MSQSPEVKTKYIPPQQRKNPDQGVLQTRNPQPSTSDNPDEISRYIPPWQRKNPDQGVLQTRNPQPSRSDNPDEISRYIPPPQRKNPDLRVLQTRNPQPSRPDNPDETPRYKPLIKKLTNRFKNPTYYDVQLKYVDPTEIQPHPQFYFGNYSTPKKFFKTIEEDRKIDGKIKLGRYEYISVEDEPDLNDPQKIKMIRIPDVSTDANYLNRELEEKYIYNSPIGEELLDLLKPYYYDTSKGPNYSGLKCYEFISKDNVSLLCENELIDAIEKWKSFLQDKTNITLLEECIYKRNNILERIDKTFIRNDQIDKVNVLELLSQDDPPGSELLSQDNLPVLDLLSQDNPPVSDLLSQDNSPGSELLSQDNPPSSELLSQDNPPGSELLSQDNPPGSELLSQDNPPGSELLSQDNPPGSELLSQDDQNKNDHIHEIFISPLLNLYVKQRDAKFTQEAIDLFYPSKFTYTDPKYTLDYISKYIIAFMRVDLKKAISYEWAREIMSEYTISFQDVLDKLRPVPNENLSKLLPTYNYFLGKEGDIIDADIPSELEEKPQYKQKRVFTEKEILENYLEQLSKNNCENIGREHFYHYRYKNDSKHSKKLLLEDVLIPDDGNSNTLLLGSVPLYTGYLYNPKTTTAPWLQPDTKMGKLTWNFLLNKAILSCLINNNESSPNPFPVRLLIDKHRDVFKTNKFIKIDDKIELLGFFINRYGNEIYKYTEYLNSLNLDIRDHIKCENRLLEKIKRYYPPIFDYTESYDVFVVLKKKQKKILNISEYEKPDLRLTDMTSCYIDMGDTRRNDTFTYS